MVIWKCKNCGKKTDYQPNQGICGHCAGPKIGYVEPLMKFIAYNGYYEEGQPLALYQCPVCKTVAYNIGYTDTLCREAHGIV